MCNMSRSNLLVVVSTMAFLGACSNADLIRQAERAKPAGDDFSRAMHREYLDLAKSQEAQGDRGAAKHYLTKSLLAAKGNEVMPDDPARRSITGPEEAPIKAGYGKLTSALKAGAAKRKPNDAAKAQAMFDCWVEQSEEGYQPSDIQACRTGFESALAAIGDIATSAERTPAASGSFVVHFKFDSVELTDKSRSELTRILEKVGAEKPKAVTVTGYTDLVGNEKYNNGLSARRAGALGGKLKAAGAGSVTATGKGSSDPVEKTKKPSEANRRAVIVFQ